MLRFIVSILLAATCCLGAERNARADDRSSDPIHFQRIQELEKKGEWKTAIELLKKQPAHDAQYFYNLGTLHLRAGEAGLAVAYLEKANHREPHNPTTQQNLTLARREFEKQLGVNTDAASNWVEAIADRVPIDEVRGALGLLGCVLVLFWMRSYLKTRRLRKTLLQPAAVLSMIGLSVTLALYAMERYAAQHPPACLLKKETIRSGPADTYLELAQLHVGSKVRVLGSESDWLQIRFADSSVGWVPASSLLLL